METKNYKPITTDNEVEKVENVIIEEVVTQSVGKKYSVSGIDDMIKSINLQITAEKRMLNKLEDKKNELQDKRAIILNEAEKIKLKRKNV
jgi:uncharacterized protein (DUF2164 family)